MIGFMKRLVALMYEHRTCPSCGRPLEYRREYRGPNGESVLWAPCQECQP